ncbi:hypothetical protein GCM10007377_07930 [Galliscardovia ingluviei]|uniref:Uncharacterized protein n=1 Tax=Galliscardovia ingluviei TaxID=1769422 RepID=A0A8J3AN37_9BIFI|nr:hypothetical protein [Galliscardovia ingluviei]GGI13832.1 hypothetical protein GCM10007377_07930 [Galliscardovia ingluviei]
MSEDNKLNGRYIPVAITIFAFVIVAAMTAVAWYFDTDMSFYELSILAGGVILPCCLSVCSMYLCSKYKALAITILCALDAIVSFILMFKSIDIDFYLEMNMTQIYTDTHVLIGTFSSTFTNVCDMVFAILINVAMLYRKKE